MNNKIIAFKKLLYPNDIEAEELNETQTKKVIYEALREILKTRQYQFEINSYKFDVTPQNLSVIYNSSDTYIEVSNDDVRYETIRTLPTRYFVYSDTKQNEYPDNTLNIEVNIEITSYDNKMNRENIGYNLNALDPTASIKSLLQVPKEFTITEDPYINDPRLITISRDINRNDKLEDIALYFNTDKIRPVTYDYFNHKFIPTTFTTTETYNDYLPSLDKKKKVISLIYSTIVNFYNEYMNK